MIRHSQRTPDEKSTARERLLTLLDGDRTVRSLRTRDHWIREGERCCRAGDLQRSSATFQRILTQWPNDYDALCGLAYVRFMQGAWRDALELLRSAIELQPTTRRAYDQSAYMGRHAIETHREPEEVCEILRAALAMNPRHAASRAVLAGGLLQMGRLDAARLECERAVQADPKCLDAREIFARLLRELGEPRDAVRQLNEAARLAQRRMREASSANGAIGSDRMVELRRKRADLLNDLGDVLSSIGEERRAISTWRDVAKLSTANPRAIYELSRRTPDVGDAASFERLEAVIGDSNKSAAAKVWAHFALGSLHERCKSHERAFGHYAQGNDTADARFDRSLCRATTDILIRAADARKPRRSSRETPVFIVGMPGAGTRVVERLLASHPDMESAGESKAMGRAMRAAVRMASGGRTDVSLEVLRSLTDEQAAEAAKTYLDAVRRTAPKATRIVDALPMNYAKLGFIARLFPEARVIHCRRHPMDACLACYTTHHGAAKDAMGFAYDLHDLAEYYLQYDRLMRHWSNELPLGVLDVRYEDVVASPERYRRRLFGFCELANGDPIDDDETDRLCETVGRWRQFEPQLASLRDRLQPLIDAWDLERSGRTTGATKWRVDFAPEQGSPHMTINAKHAAPV